MKKTITYESKEYQQCLGRVWRNGAELPRISMTKKEIKQYERARKKMLKKKLACISSMSKLTQVFFFDLETSGVGKSLL